MSLPVRVERSYPHNPRCKTWAVVLTAPDGERLIVGQWPHPSGWISIAYRTKRAALAAAQELGEVSYPPEPEELLRVGRICARHIEDPKDAAYYAARLDLAEQSRAEWLRSQAR